MSAQHTPGPWFIHTEDDRSIFQARVVYICDDRGWPDGQLSRVNVQDGLGEREANARLIAAAPDLLEALVEFFHSGDFDIETTGDPAATEAWLEKARAAIAKARGEA